MMWDIQANRRPELIEALGKCGAGKRVVRLRSPRDIAAFLRRTGERGARGAGR